MEYNTKYFIEDNKTKEVIFTNKNTACFAEFTSVLWPSKKLKDIENTKSTLVVIIDIKHSETGKNYYSHARSKDTVEKWVKGLNCLGFPMKATFLDAKTSKYPSNINKYSSTEWAEVRLDFTKYKSKNKIVIALHLLRWCFENLLIEAVDFCLDLKEKNPKLSWYNCIIGGISFYKYKEGYLPGHSAFPPGNTYIVDFKSFKEHLKEVSAKTYSNNSVTNINAYISLDHLNGKVKEKDIKKVIKVQKLKS